MPTRFLCDCRRTAARNDRGVDPADVMLCQQFGERRLAHALRRTGDVACNRAVSRPARLKTSGAPDRRDLPGVEGHVRRCVPGKRVMNRP